MILLCNQQSFICTHIDYCHPHCYLHHSRSCARLVRAIKLLYGDTVDSLRENSTLNSVARGKKQKEVSRWKKQNVLGFVWAGHNYLQGLHNVLKQFFHDKMNTTLPKHSSAVKKNNPINSFSIMERV